MRISDWSSDVCSSDLVSWLALSRPPVLSAHHKSRTPELRSLGLLPSSPADRPAGGTGATASLRYERNRRKTAHAENQYPDIILRGPPGPCRRRGWFSGEQRVQHSCCASVHRD